MMAQELINQSSTIVILTHISPDGDAMGSSLAMRHFLEAQSKQVSVIVPNSFPDFLAWLPGADQHIIYEHRQAEADVLLEQAELVICTDFNDPKRIGSLGEKMLSLTCKKMMIDHHLHPASFPDLTLSLDTYWSEVVSRSYDTIGEFIVNDISAGDDDPQMLPLVGRLGLKYIAMHKRGTPGTMQSLTNYNDIAGDVLEYFRQFAQKALHFEIKDWIIDPGFGFAKTLEQNYQLLSRLDQFKQLRRPLLVGVSRKSMIYKYLNISPEDALPATQVVHLKALQMGADILRVHDVAEAVRTVELFRILG